MGGEYDATNVFDKSLSIFTPIGLDHTDMLGNSLEEIAKTKLNAMCDLALISSEFTCMQLAKKIANDKGANLIIQKIYLPMKLIYTLRDLIYPSFYKQT